jgi:hydrogenase/urease accessory protein HupE
MINLACYIALFGFLFLPCTASAHVPIEGINNFYNGMLHPVLVPAHLLLLLATGLFIGQQGLSENRGALVVFLVATILGLVVASFSININLEVILLCIAAVTGILIAISPVVGLLGCSLIAAFVGFSLGADSGQVTMSGKEKLATLFGSGVGIYLLVLYPMGLVDRFNDKAWQKIGVRVIGSWVAAASFMVLALSFSNRP